MSEELPKLPRGEGTFLRRKDGRIAFKKRIKLPDDQVVSKTVYGKTAKECMKKMREAEKDLKEKNISQSDEVLCDAMYSWLANTKKNTLKVQSYQRIESTIRNQIESSNIGHDKYQSISSDEVQDLINQLVNDNYSHSVIKKTYDTLNDFYRTASLKYGFDNPMLTVTMPTKSNVKSESREIVWLEKDDIEKFIEESKKTWKTGRPRYSGALVISANIYMGLRCGELLALQWKDVDFENGSVYVSKTLVEIRDFETHRTTFKIQNSSKTDKNRYVPLNDKAKELLLMHKKQSTFIEPEDYVISTRNRKTTTIKNVADTIKAIEQNANTRVQASGTHSIRHTTASLYFRAGVPIEIIAKILGHDVETCRNTYIHFVEEQLKNASKQIIPMINI